MGFRAALTTLSYKLKSIVGTKELQFHAKKLNELMAEDYIRTHLYQNPRYQDPKKLNQYEFQAFSQSGEDGIVEEIFKRIGVTNRYFVEFGAANGLWNNTAYLLMQGWQGLWIEGDARGVGVIQQKFAPYISRNTLAVQQAMITRDNIQQLFGSGKVPKELDLLSIDIDGNDYWVWEAISDYTPRVVVIEYNPVFRPPVSWVMRYNPTHVWGGTSYYGASITALEKLGTAKGYCLVGCDFLGSNAFFVRSDLVKDKFAEPYTAENHFEPPRYFLLKDSGHPRDIGDFGQIEE
ncbi:MAG: hypothetical protein AAB701_02570 [Patescibacteria group bacterium]